MIRADLPQSIHCKIKANAIAKRRGLKMIWTLVQQTAAVQCDKTLMRIFSKCIAQRGLKVLKLPSGAGHDAAALSAICPVAMLFVRCKGGISHNPAESLKTADMRAWRLKCWRISFKLWQRLIKQFMNPKLGLTRTVIKRNYALITPDGHVPSVFPGWTDCTPIVLISSALGAGLSQFLISLDVKSVGSGETGK